MRALALIAVVVVVSSAPSLATVRAQEGTSWSIAWARAEGAEECIDERALRERIAALLGRDPFAGASHAERAIEGIVTREDDGFRARVVARGLDNGVLGARQLSDADCAALGDTLALTIALVIDPDALAASSAPPVPVPAEEPPAAPEPEARPTPPVLPAARVALEGGASIVGLPSVVPVVGLAGEVRLFERWLWLRALVWSATEQRFDADRLAIGAWGASLGVCADPLALDAVYAGACVGAAVAVVHAYARALEPIDPGARVRGGPAITLRGGVVLGPVLVSLAVEVAAPLPPYRYVIEGSGRVAFETPPVALSGVIGVGAQVP